MALSGNTVWEVRQGGSDTNGGGYVTGSSGTDWSQQNAAQYAVTDGVTNGTTTITSASANFGPDVVGNLVYVAGGTGSVAPGWYQITGRTSSTTIVVDRSTGLTSGTGVTLTIGGALATPGQAAAAATNGNHIWAKYAATPYGLTTSTAGPAGPVILATGQSIAMEGYDQARGDRTGNRPILQWQTSPASATSACKGNGSARQAFLNLAVDGNGQSNACGIDISNSRVSASDCATRNCNQSGCFGFNAGTCGTIRCSASNCTTGFQGGNIVDCLAGGCTTGFTNFGFMSNCVASGCILGFGWQSSISSLLFRCTADACTTGFQTTSSSFVAALANCLATNCTGTGAIGFDIHNNAVTLHNCAVYNNTTHVSGTPLVNEGFITLSANPYVNQPSGDFRPNSSNPGGGQLWNAGIGVFGQADNSDIGAVQHSDPTGGAATYVINKVINNYYFDSPEP